MHGSPWAYALVSEAVVILKLLTLSSRPGHTSGPKASVFVNGSIRKRHVTRWNL